MIHDVVAVPAAGARFQVRRSVGVGDAELGELGRDAGGVTEGEVSLELQSVGRLRERAPRRDGASSLLQKGFDRIAH